MHYSNLKSLNLAFKAKTTNIIGQRENLSLAKNKKRRNSGADGAFKLPLSISVTIGVCALPAPGIGHHLL